VSRLVPEKSICFTGAPITSSYGLYPNISIYFLQPTDNLRQAAVIILSTHVEMYKYRHSRVS
jgi:hypothetical protein